MLCKLTKHSEPVTHKLIWNFDQIECNPQEWPETLQVNLFHNAMHCDHIDQGEFDQELAMLSVILFSSQSSLSAITANTKRQR